MDIKVLKEKIEGLDPATHGALRNALHVEYQRLTGSLPDLGPDGIDPELLRKIFQRTVDKINERYIQGTIAHISRNHPDLDRRINDAESAVNDIWFKCERGKASIEEFKAKIEEWYRLNLQAINIYSKVKFK